LSGEQNSPKRLQLLKTTPPINSQQSSISN
jgi:hypothetical protein